MTMIEVHKTGEAVWTLVDGKLTCWRVDADGLTPLENTPAALSAVEDGVSIDQLDSKPIRPAEEGRTTEERMLLERYRIWHANQESVAYSPDDNFRRFINSMVQTG